MSNYAIMIFLQGKGNMCKTDKSKFNIPFFVQEILDGFFAAGENAYIVGGSLRDMMIGNEPNDFDLASSAEPDRVCEIFSDKRIIKTGIAHGTVTVISHGFPIEITTFRVDGDYLDMRRPDSVKFTRRIEDDLSRRDFTVNAMAYNDRDGLIDLFCGAEDIEAKIIRTVGDPMLRFSEDALRILRAFRFSAKLGFEIEGDTLSATSALCDKLSYIAKERIFSELCGIIQAKGATKALEMMADAGVMRYVLCGYSPSPETLAQISDIRSDLILRFAALFSDSDGETARRELSALKASTKLRVSVARVVDAAKAEYSTREDVARLRARVGEDFERALELSILLGNSQESVKQYLEDKTPCDISELKIGGRELSAIGYKGKEIGDELYVLLERVIERPELNVAEMLLKIAKKDKGQGE